MSDIKENEESGQDVPVPMDEDQMLGDTQVQAHKETAPPLPVEEASNGTGNEKVTAEAEEMKLEADVVSRPLTESEDQSSLQSVLVKDTSQNLLQPEGQNTSDVKTVVDDANVNDGSSQNDETIQANQDAKEGNEAVGADKVNCGDKTGESSEGNEAQKVIHASEAHEAQGVSQPNEAHEAKQSYEATGVNGASQTNGTIEVKELHEKDVTNDSSMMRPDNAETASDIKVEATGECEVKEKLVSDSVPPRRSNPSTPEGVLPDSKNEKENQVEARNEKKAVGEVENENKYGNTPSEKNKHACIPAENGTSGLKHYFLDDDHAYGGNESGTEEEQSAFMKELENFFREKCMEFKPPKFYGEGLNCLKLWRAVMRLGGYDKVTSCKLWRQVGESFKPPKTCTTVSWTFRGFYEKALLEYERHMTRGGEIAVPPVASPSEPLSTEQQTPGSGRARRDAAARAMQGWHSQRLLGNGEVSDPIIKDKNSISLQKREKQLKSFNLLKRKKPPYLDNAVKAARSKPSKPQLDTAVVDIGPPADWVKINVQKTKDCFEVYALVPGLLREEVRVQSDPAGRLVITGEPEQLDNPWGVTPFKKVVTLPSRIDPHQTSAVVTLHGQLFVRVPFEQSE